MPSAAGSRKMSTRKLPENRMMPEIDKMEAALSRGEARYRDIAWNIYTSDEAKAYRGEA
jgi:hypothetical protein